MRPRLLIPGTGGITFKRGDGTQSPYVADMILSKLAARIPRLIAKWLPVGPYTSDEIVKEFSCVHGPEPIPQRVDDLGYGEAYAPERSTLGPAGEVGPGHTLMETAYSGLDDSYEVFDYDWRLDIRHNGARLKKYLERHADRGGQPFDVVCHSQGGHVLVAASLLFRRHEDFHALVRQVAFVGVPFAGCVNAMDAVLRGDAFPMTDTSMFRTMARTWPAIAQMMPTWDMGANTHGRLNGKKPHDSPHTVKSWHRSWWPGELAPPDTILDRAKGWNDWIGPYLFNRIDPNCILVLMGNKPNNTLAYLRLNQAGKVTREVKVAGDTLVPFDKTYAFLIDRVEPQKQPGLASRIQEITGNDMNTHSMLLNKEHTVRRIHDFFDS